MNWNYSLFHTVNATNEPPHEAEAQTNLHNQGRRGFLRQAAVVTGLATTAALTLNPNAARAQATSGRVTLNQELKLVQRHENDHVAFLVNSLGASARPKPTFQNLTASNVANFLTLGRAFENTGVGAYLGAAPVIFSRDNLAAAASIAQVEARHAGMFNVIQSRAQTENVFGQELSFERALTQEEVVQLVSPYVADLNGGPPLAFGTTPSASNDVLIFNFALALEYLEAEYYNINVPRFYP